MSYLAKVWVRPSAGSGDFAVHYNLGRGALANEDWPAARDAFGRAATALREHADWPGLWLCLVALAATAWRTEEGEAALHHARESYLLADRIADLWPRAWSLWLLGHLYAAHHQQVDAYGCFHRVHSLLDTDDDDQQMVRSLALVAAALCADAGSDPDMLVERLFGLARLGCQIASKRGIPVEALLGLERAPRLSRTQIGRAAGGGRGPIEWLRSFLPRPEAPLELPALPEAPRRPGADHEADPAPGDPELESGPAASDDAVPAMSAHCLGKFELWLGHRPVSQWAGGKSKLLLKRLLAAYPSPVSAASLMDALWSGVEEELARQRLHTAISDLRRALRAVDPDAGELVVSQSGGYGLSPTALIRIDTLAFERARRAGLQYEQLGRLDEARAAYCRGVELYRGDYLEEDLYEDWPTERREKLKAEYVAMLTRLAQWAFNAGEYEACLGWGRLTLECDPCHEYTHRLLMRSFGRLGQRAAAIRQYRQCVEALRSELDAVPEAESEELYERLRQGQEI